MSGAAAGLRGAPCYCSSSPRRGRIVPEEKRGAECPDPQASPQALDTQRLPSPPVAPSCPPRRRTLAASSRLPAAGLRGTGFGMPLRKSGRSRIAGTGHCHLVGAWVCWRVANSTFCEPSRAPATGWLRTSCSLEMHGHPQSGASGMPASPQATSAIA